MALPGGPPALWSAEEPHLYLLILEMRGPGGQALEFEAAQVRNLRNLTIFVNARCASSARWQRVVWDLPLVLLLLTSTHPPATQA